MSENVIIIGSGPAGLTAALNTARANLSPLLISGNEFGGQIALTNEVENYPGFPDGITGPELTELMKQQAEKFGARFELDHVSQVDFSKHPFTLDTENGVHYEAKSVVIATGGGTFADPDNRAVMLSDGAVAWLDLPLQHVVERIPSDGRRPLAADRAQMEKLYEWRQQAYREAHVRLDAGRPVDEIVERLLEWIGY